MTLSYFVLALLLAYEKTTPWPRALERVTEMETMKDKVLKKRNGTRMTTPTESDWILFSLLVLWALRYPW